MHQQLKLSNNDIFAYYFGFCREPTCKADKPYCAECLFNYCLNKYKVDILLDSDLMFQDEVELSGLLLVDLYEYNFQLWLQNIENIFLGVYSWIINNYNLELRNYYELLKYLSQN